MDETIINRQNERDMLLLLKAQRHAYSKSKWIQYPSTLLSIVGTVLFSYITTKHDTNLLNTLSVVFALFVFILNVLLEKAAEKFTELGAKLQQTFDVKLFGLPEGCCELTQSEIDEITATYEHSDLSEFRDWYSDYSKLDPPKQVFLSQKENIRWNSKLSKKYFWFNFILGIIFSIFIIGYAISCDIKTTHFFAIVSWLFPVAQYIITKCTSLNANIKLLERNELVFKNIEQLYDNYEVNELGCKLCTLQSYIFESRKRKVLIPDWLYKTDRKKTQPHEDAIARQSTSKIIQNKKDECTQR